MSGLETLCHATCVAVNGNGVLICGKSGSGKSDLALRLIDSGAVLVADDTVLLSNDNGVLVANVPDTVAGFLEVRGMGIVQMPFVRFVPVKLKVVLCPDETIDRMPETETEILCRVSVPVLRLNGFQASAAAKLRCALGVTIGKIKVVS